MTAVQGTAAAPMAHNHHVKAEACSTVPGTSAALPHTDPAASVNAPSDGCKLQKPTMAEQNTSLSAEELIRIAQAATALYSGQLPSPSCWPGCTSSSGPSSSPSRAASAGRITHLAERSPWQDQQHQWEPERQQARQQAAASRQWQG